MIVSNKKISDYALLGDCHSAALVATDGSIDWLCFPRFDSGSVFGHILDNRKGGSFFISPVSPQKVKRSYLEDTNILVSEFHSAQGIVKLTDCMPVEKTDDVKTGNIRSYHSVLRKIECISGEVDVRIVIAPRFEYGSFTPRFRLSSQNTCEIVGGADALWVTSSRPLNVQNHRVKTRWRLKQGETVWVECAWSDSFTEKDPQDHPSIAALEQRLESTIVFWRDWMKSFQYQGESQALVKRSALVLKALTYAPTGAIVAAPTTSLPEEIGGERNWDYRYSWIRDTTLTLISLMVLGFKGEVNQYRQYFRRTSAGRAEDIQIMYSITGERLLPEIILEELSGHRNSRPVRLGNGAVKQVQLDIFGQLLDAVFIYTRIRGEVSQTNWAFIKGVTDIVAKKWQEPDQGIWEIRDEPRHFVHSKVQCWLALDRAIKISKNLNFHANIEHWVQQKKLIEKYLLEKGAEKGYFTQAVGYNDADAAVLLTSAAGFLSVKHEIMQKTIDFVRSELENNGLLLRYKNSDGIQGEEGGFLLCSFWLLDCLIHSGKIDEAERLLEKLTGLANDVGLFAEEADMKTGELLGNFPQAFTHMALVTSHSHLFLAKKGKIPKGDAAYSYSDFALEQLFAK